MADQVQREDDQNLWRARYTTEEGWGPAVAFADHLSVAAPALAEVEGTLYCAHRGARQEDEQQPLRWTAFEPAATLPLVAALEEASKPLPEGATAEQEAQRQKDIRAAADALDEARKWTPDAVAGKEQVSEEVWERWEEEVRKLKGEERRRFHLWMHRVRSFPQNFLSAETPALVNDGGTLRMVFTHINEFDQPALSETHREAREGKVHWVSPTSLRLSGKLLAPALAVFNGAVHLLVANQHTGSVGHYVRAADGTWKRAAGADGKAIPTPSCDSKPNEFVSFKGNEHGYPGNLALAVHDKRLHLVYRESTMYPSLWHAVYDGTAWSVAEPLSHGGSLVSSRRSATLASYDGKLHAVYPHPTSDKLCHTTWTKDGGWTKPAELDGHDSRNTPALLTFKEGPAGAERETLLLVHRGVDRYVPPTPPQAPAPPAPPSVKSRGETATGDSVSDYGEDAWSRVKHQASLTPVTVKGSDKPAVIATWEATAEYYWGSSWYPENYGNPYSPSISSGTLYLWEGTAGKGKVRTVDFSGSFDACGRFRHDAIITDLKPGTYELWLGGTNTKKTGGYWYASRSAITTDEPDKDRYARIHNFSCAIATITL